MNFLCNLMIFLCNDGCTNITETSQILQKYCDSLICFLFFFKSDACFFFQLKELGVIVYDCSCLAMDLHRIFALYWQLQYRDYIPSIWSKRVTAVFSKDEPLELKLNNTDAYAYVSVRSSFTCSIFV